MMTDLRQRLEKPWLSLAARANKLPTLRTKDALELALLKSIGPDDVVTQAQAFGIDKIPITPILYTTCQRLRLSLIHI